MYTIKTEMSKKIVRKTVLYNRPEVAGLFYHENWTYYHNANGSAGKVILMYPAPAGKEQRKRM